MKERVFLEIIDIEDQFKKFESVESKLIFDGKMKGMPKLSIMIPTYRRPDLLREALCSALEQTADVRYEVVVVDNDITMAEKVDEIVMNMNNDRIRLFRNVENIGMFGNWNRCIELARAEWVSILNDDDLLHRNFIEKMIAVAEQNKKINLLYCRTEFMDDRGSQLRRLRSQVRQKFKRIKGGLMLGNVVQVKITDVYLDSPCSALGMIFKRSHAIKLGGYKAAAFPSADYVFFAMYFLNFGAYRLNKILSYYRIHENETANPVTGEGFIVKNIELRKSMERYISAPTSLLRLYAQLYALNTTRQYRDFWGVTLDVDRIRKELGLTRLPAMPLFLVIRFVMHAYFFVTSIFSHEKSDKGSTSI